MYKVLKIVIYTVFTFILVFGNSVSFAQYKVEDIPSPKLKGQPYFVSNPDHILSESATNELDAISWQIDSITKCEFAIVIVNDYVGDSDFDFALQLFNTWGIGKKESNNGLLLFIAKDRHEYRFISGYGMESILPDAYLKRIGEKFLVPNFREEDYDRGVLESSQFIQKILKAPDAQAELDRLMPETMSFWNLKNPHLRNSLLVLFAFIFFYVWLEVVTNMTKGKITKKSQYFPPLVSGFGCMGLLMFITIFIFAFVFQNVKEVYQVKNLPYFILVFGVITLGMKYNASITAVTNSYKDEENIQNATRKFLMWSFVPLLLSPLAWIDFGKSSRRLKRQAGRLIPPDDSGNWLRMNRDDTTTKINAFLDRGQLMEEKINSRDYEIWINNKTNETKLIPWDQDNKITECPKCHYKTFETDLRKTITKASYSAGGLEEKYDLCQYCDYTISHGTHSTPRLVRSSSSSGGSGGSSGGSGGGSFGGGSSGGGGAGGRW
ncbi:TPM domain-containing protein [Sphingobacterium sp. SRCM116780]|uniref:TPM domain-containing protein n=1 Tax=Sphingobacterium sp. SRCM116780 TaxID=2907623 RepID=UPI001F1FCC7D|nr:TPM domain-containing protein [Sphingobacterium sp. SRCM116780]UIR55496.1 TPM domain-containing protein [Sphingobacterium sp. SRCM116780]